MKILITGGAGFIGSAVIHHLIAATDHQVVNIDKLTYAGHPDSLAGLNGRGRYTFLQLDICNARGLGETFDRHQPDAVMHLAAESHVDRSIDEPADFIHTNLVGTYTLLEAARRYWAALPGDRQQRFRFHHVSTDEVFGDLGSTREAATERAPYRPSSPYAASKAGADHLVRAWHRTYGLPILVSNSTNNYGPRQHPEKLIPLMLGQALRGRPLPIYGHGRHIRDWLYVEDHARALEIILARGRAGHTYNIGAREPQTNIDVVHRLCALLEEMTPRHPPGVRRYADLIRRVPDRPGHDRRYALDTTKIRRDLGWAPQETFEEGLRKTVRWYLDHRDWCDDTIDGSQLFHTNG